MATVGRVWATGKIDTVEVSPTPKSPVRTETITRTVIEPGVYGRLRVKPTKGPHVQVKLVTIHGKEITEAALNAAELRELARIATELADGLDAQ